MQGATLESVVLVSERKDGVLNQNTGSKKKDNETDERDI